ncbi:hypothetical protein K458DRAFT_383773 [Lentithecium fluviatile CBS 122367]|uniref:Stc1 domain-containing protein n=1 Tax=Lentithecium fluviatile CBS 122367 TaxID=1168545 RepID=A0A6G1JFV8_9PLEO|nr:hypothetical protein K458DRAFT_383773 [Lentithecium fluviatile CBS 122367]
MCIVDASDQTAHLISLEGVPLPEKIKCDRCRHFKSQKNFSNRSLHDARRAIQQHGPHAKYKINCQQCTGRQIVELRCSMCNKTKGLEDFAKSQRAKLSDAECYACVEARLAQDAVNEEVYDGDDPSKAFTPTESVSGNFPSVWDTTTTATESEAGDDWQDSKDDDGEAGGINLSVDFARKLTMHSNHETLIETEYESGSQANDGVDWQTVPTKSWHTKSQNTASTSSGFDPNKYGTPSNRPSIASVSGSVRTFTSGYAEHDTMSCKNGWAKIKACDPKKDPEYQLKFKPVQEEDWSSDEGEQNGADDSDSDDDDVSI